MENYVKISEALSKAQGQIEAAEKSQENAAFTRGSKKSMYANLSDVIEVIRKPAMSNGLSVLFNFKTENNAQWIKYVLIHVSGELIESEWVEMLMSQRTQHAFGGANTYYRRQLLKAIYQIPEDDDDGNEASKSPAPVEPPGKPPLPEKPKNYAPKNMPTPPEHLFEGQAFPEEANDLTLLEQLYRVVFVKEMSIDEVQRVIKMVTGVVKKSTDMTDLEIKGVLKYIELSK